MFPNVKLGIDSDDTLPQGAKDLRQGYALLHACQKMAKPVEEAEARTILRYWEAHGWPNMDDWPQDVKRWARLRLLNGQTVCSRWYESQSSHCT